MLAASIFGIFLIPMLYVVFQRMREAMQRRDVADAGEPGGAVDAEGQ
jgi:HAE1 family hydrophobic/amphiphilic exporter-1